MNAYLTAIASAATGFPLVASKRERVYVDDTDVHPAGDFYDAYIVYPTSDRSSNLNIRVREYRTGKQVWTFVDYRNREAIDCPSASTIHELLEAYEQKYGRRAFPVSQPKLNTVRGILERDIDSGMDALDTIEDIRMVIQ